MKQDPTETRSEDLPDSSAVATGRTMGTSNADPIDIEEYATKDRPAPDGARYRIRVDRTMHVVDGPLVTGRQILVVSDHVPVEHWRLDQRFRGGATKKVELEEVVDLRAKGLERFMTLPLDQTEGACHRLRSARRFR